MKPSLVRGTQDLFGNTLMRHRLVSTSALNVAERFGYHEIQTPIFEHSEVFQRSLGEASDVVQKEMYNFVDKSGHSITLRPENTAGVARAFISNHMEQRMPVRLFYNGPMFRYERPQKGRMRQFHQIGAELIGVSNPEADVEVIACGQMILEELKIAQQTTLHLNTLGNIKSRKLWRDALHDYFVCYSNDLSKESKKRLQHNPLRILDSKDENDRKLLDEAPVFDSYIDDESKYFFEQVQEGLAACNINWIIDTRLVRGLDYYCHTAFEFITTALGAQGTVMGGGRYDGLIHQLGGPAIAGVGWAAGVERLAMLLDAQDNQTLRVALIAVGEGEHRSLLHQMANQLRKNNHTIIVPVSSQLKKAMRESERAGVRICLLLGEDEYHKSCFKLRDMQTGEQREIGLDTVEEVIKSYAI